jgi:hypothetical protein
VGPRLAKKGLPWYALDAGSPFGNRVCELLFEPITGVIWATVVDQAEFGVRVRKQAVDGLLKERKPTFTGNNEPDIGPCFSRARTGVRDCVE